MPQNCFHFLLPLQGLHGNNVLWVWGTIVMKVMISHKELKFWTLFDDLFVICLIESV